MKIVKKIIYLEQYKSRLPGMVSSYDLDSDMMVDFDKEAMSDGESNYGMIPNDIVYNGKNYTFKNLIAEYKKKSDKKNKEKSDDDFIKFVDNKIVPKFNLKGKPYRDGWDADFLYLPDAIRWKNYMKDLSKKDKKRDCCEEKEFNEKGSNFFITQVEQWLNNVIPLDNGSIVDFSFEIPILFTTTIDDMGEFSIFSKDYEYRNEYYENDTVFYNDNMFVKNNETRETDTDINNEFLGSFYSNRYKENYFANKSELSRTFDNEWYNKSYTDEQKEKLVNQWNNIWEKVEKDEKFSEYKEFIPNLKDNNDKPMCYACDKYGKYMHKCSYDFINKTEYKISEITETSKFIYIINKKEYTQSDIKKRFNIKDTDNENSERYIKDNVVYFKSKNLDGRTVIREYYPIKYYCVINDDTSFIYKDDEGNKRIGIYTVLYESDEKIERKIHKLIANKYSSLGEYIDATDYSNYKNSYTNYVNIHGYKIRDNDLIIFEPFFLYSFDAIKTTSESKLNYLTNLKTAYDDMGNKLPGSFKEEKHDNILKIVQPTVNDELALPYKIGNVNDVTIFKETDNKTYYWGDIIDNIIIEFNYTFTENGKTDDGQDIEISKMEHMVYDIKEKKEKNNEYLLPIVIKDIVDDAVKGKTNVRVNYDSIEGTFIYYIGCILEKDDNEKYKRCVDVFNSDKIGVKYYDHVHIKPNNLFYYANKEDRFNLNYYDLLFKKQVKKINDKSAKEIILSDIEYNNEFITFDDNYSYEDSINSFREPYDGFIASQVFREEYKLGSSSMENIDAYIYIDRGVSNAFEKHLKLTEINSLESLEQYGNGFFKINKS